MSINVRKENKNDKQKILFSHKKRTLIMDDWKIYIGDTSKTMEVTLVLLFYFEQKK